MSSWFPSRPDPDEELKAADDLLHKADALLRRHKGTDREPEVEVSLEDEELPLLTEVVEDLEDDLPILTEEVEASALQAPEPEPAPPPPEAPEPAQDVALAEFLIDLDTEIAREVETWFSSELPQLLSRELDRLAERLRAEAVAHLRATLLPALSEHVSRRLEELSKPKG